MRNISEGETTGQQVMEGQGIDSFRVSCHRVLVSHSGTKCAFAVGASLQGPLWHVALQPQPGQTCLLLDGLAEGSLCRCHSEKWSRHSEIINSWCLQVRGISMFIVSFFNFCVDLNSFKIKYKKFYLWELLKKYIYIFRPLFSYSSLSFQEV